MKTFKQFYENTIGSALGGLNAFALHGGDVENTDWYAPNDTRLPKILGTKIQTRQKSLDILPHEEDNEKLKKKRKRKRKRNGPRTLANKINSRKK